jgi:phosphoglycerate dehydrogenase-like enzyme
MPRILTLDPILVTGEHRVGPGWAGPEHEVITPESFTPEAIFPHLGEAEAVLTAHTLVTAEMMDRAPLLRLIAKPGTGVDNIDVAAAAARGILVTNVHGVRGRAVAEHALFMMLYLTRHAWMEHDPAWRETMSVQLGGKRLGVVGLGAIGSLLARSCHGLGMDIAAHTRTPDPDRVPGVPIAFLGREQLLRQSDFVVLCMPLTPETRGMIDRSSLGAMKASAYLINVSRGPTVVTDDLLDVMQGGHLAGAGLDVTDPEPLPPNHGLWGIDRVLISPHNAGNTNESQAEAMGRMRENVRLVLDGKEPLDPVTPGSAGPA